MSSGRAKQVDASKWAMILVAIAIAVAMYFITPLWAVAIYVVIVLAAMYYFWFRGGKRTS